MKLYFCLTILFLSIITCYKKQNDESLLPKDAKNAVLNNEKINKSELINTVKYDTLLSNQQLYISILKNENDTKVTTEYFDENSTKSFLKYNNSEITVVIKHKSKVVLDTIFKKENFLEILEENFLKVSVLYEYQFEKFENGIIIFNGSIQKPDTDWIIRFNHYYDLKTNKFSIEELVEDEY